MGQIAAGDGVGSQTPVGLVGARRRPWWSRVSGAHVLTVLVAIVAFVLNLALLRDPELAEMAVARADVLAGTELTEDLIRWVEVDGSSAMADSLIRRADFEGLAGQVLASGYRAGDPILRSTVRPPAAPSSLRSFALPVDEDRASGGLIVPGDQVDVIATVDGKARYVITGAQVLSVPTEERRGIASGSGYFLVLAVDSDAALALAEALDSAAIDVVRSTGSPPPERLASSPDPTVIGE